MPPKKSKGGSKGKDPETTATKEADKKKKTNNNSSEPSPPKTVNERTRQVYYQTNPAAQRVDEAEGGILGLTTAERQTWAHAQLLPRVAGRRATTTAAAVLLPTVKAEREFWKQVGRDNIPARSLRSKTHTWGKDRTGRDIGEYSPEEYTERQRRELRVTVLSAASEKYKSRRDLQRLGRRDRKGDEVVVSAEETEEERKRRREISVLKKELYGTKMTKYMLDPDWDDVVPIPADEPEMALASIAYPEDYAEAMSYLRAVMAVNECSQRAMNLTTHIIQLNPAHYTVWLFRFKVISALDLSVEDEIAWLNEVALSHLKNYQIWHHRHLLVDQLYSKIAGDRDAVARLARSETEFLTQMLSHDAKNYHVWSYRQFLVRRLGMFGMRELLATQNFIETDVRNNSAWSHRFFVVFSDPAVCSKEDDDDGSAKPTHPTEADPKLPAATVDREISYAQEKIGMAPQNQAAWNYLRGVLAKGGRTIASVAEFCEGFVENLGEGDGKEVVRSSHALDALADAYAERGDKEKAKLCLTRLAEKWDPIRSGYWQYREELMNAA